MNMAESVMIRLTLKGSPRNVAHEIIRELSMKAYEEGLEFKEALVRDSRIRKYLSEEEIEEALDPKRYLGNYKELIERAKKRVLEIIKMAEKGNTS